MLNCIFLLYKWKVSSRKDVELFGEKQLLHLPASYADCAILMQPTTDDAFFLYPSSIDRISTDGCLDLGGL